MNWREPRWEKTRKSAIFAAGGVTENPMHVFWDCPFNRNTREKTIRLIERAASQDTNGMTMHHEQWPQWYTWAGLTPEYLKLTARLRQLQEAMEENGPTTPHEGDVSANPMMRRPQRGERLVVYTDGACNKQQMPTIRATGCAIHFPGNPAWDSHGR